MSIAQLKLQENIAEYVIYVWQMQDLIRSSSLDTKILFKKLGLDDTNDPHSEERNWLAGLTARMKDEGVEKSGNTTEVNNILAELFFLHSTLIDVLKDSKYVEIYSKAAPHIKGLMEKSAGKKNMIEHLLIALYGWLILRIQKKEISPETTSAMSSFSKTMAYISVKYKDMKTSEINSDLN